MSHATIEGAGTRIAYGGDWNPEQWDPATVARDIELMRRAHVNLITLGVFSWALLEPREGHYELDWLARIVDRLGNAGIGVDLATGTASPPAWMARDHPETLPVTESGVRLDFGSRQQYSPSSALYRRAAAALAERLAIRFGHHPALRLWHVNNEYGGSGESFDAESQSAFQTWLRERYGSVEALNRAWGTDFWSQRYASFEQIAPPRATTQFHNPSQVLDWRRFHDHQLHACLRAEIRAIRAHSDRPITTNFMGSFPDLDYRAWARDLDVVADDSYPDPADAGAAANVAWVSDLARGLGGGRPFLLMEQTPSAVQWRERNSRKRPGQFALWSFERLAHGADGILQFQWRQSRAGSEMFHSGMVPHSGTDSPTWRESAELGAALGRLTGVAHQPVRAGAAIVVDWDSEWARAAAIGPARRTPFQAARDWHRTLWEQGFPVDVVGPEDDLSGYRLVVVPEHFTDDPGLARALEALARSGGQVVVTGPSFVVDASLHEVLGGYLGSLRELLGVRVLEQAPLSGPVAPAPDPLADRITRAVGVPAAAARVGLEARSPALARVLDALGTPAPALGGGSWAEILAPAAEPADSWANPGVEVVAQFDGRGGGADLAGLPAITRRALPGGGGAWYAATDLDALSRLALLRLAAAHARIAPTMPDLPDGVEAARRGDVLFLLNYADRPAELAGIVGRDLLSDSECTGHAVIPPRSAMAVREVVQPAS